MVYYRNLWYPGTMAIDLGSCLESPSWDAWQSCLGSQTFSDEVIVEETPPQRKIRGNSRNIFLTINIIISL